MRKLALKDAFALARIIKAANVKKEIIAFASDIRARGEEINAEAVGMEFLATLVESCADKNVEQQLYALYADLKGTDIHTVAEYGFETVKADVKELVEQNDLKSFFQSASALMSA